MDILRRPSNKVPILVVDDDHDTADTAVLLLNYVGYEAVAAYGAEQAMSIARVRFPRAVLLDLAMPGQDGLRLARDLRQLPGMNDAILICITGYGQEHIHESARQAGCNHVMLKPIEWSELLPVLDQIGKPAAPGD